MKIWLYSQLEDSPGNRLFQEAARRRGHLVDRIQPQALHWDLRDLEERERPDLVYTRVGSAASASAVVGLQLMESWGVRCVNRVAALQKSRNKAIATVVMARAGVPVPPTVLLGQQPVEQAAERLGGPPWILKLPLSTKGQGVMIVESLRSLRSAADTLRSQGHDLLLQQFVATAGGADTRVLVLGGEARVGARRAASAADEFRSNVFLGGKAEPVDLSQQQVKVAQAAAQSLGLDIAGVDLLQGENGPLVVEVNASPGLTAAPSLPDAVVDYLEKLA